MAEEIATQVVDLYNSREQSPQYSGGIQEYIVPGLMQRSEGGIFSPDESLNGVSVVGDVEFTSSLAASPHVEYCIPPSTLTHALLATYGDGANLTIMDRLTPDNFPPHIIIWWRKADHPCIPFPALYDLSEDAKATVYAGVTEQVVDALSILEKSDRKGHIGGTWGNALIQDRALSGLSRGGSTNPLGHLHVADYSADYVNVTTRKDLSVEDRVNLYRPLDQYLHSVLGKSMGTMLRTIANDSVQDLEIVIDNTDGSNSDGHFFDGYNLKFAETPLPTALNLLTEIAGRFDNIYEQLKSLHRRYWQGELTGSSLEEELEVITEVLDIENGLPTTAKLTGLVQSLRPTRAQLATWGVEDQAATKYDNLRSKIEDSTRQQRSPLTRYIYDMLRMPGNINEVFFTLPEKMSFGYLFEPSGIRTSINERMVYVNSFRIFPVYGTKSTLVERYDGGVIRRAGS
jgi:hypothetical protein